MKMQIGRWGNSLAVRLPKALVERFRLNEGDEIDSAVIEAALEKVRDGDVQKRRAEALRRIAERRYPMPPDYRFDREEANAR